MARARSRAGAGAAAALAGLAVLVGLAALFDLGPFSDETLTERQFRTQADRICADAHERFRSIQRTEPETAVQAEAQTAELISVAQGELVEVADLNEPSSLSEPVGRYLDARERGIELLQHGLDAARDNDGDAYAQAQARLAGGQLDRLRIARRIGLRECSRPITSRARLARDAAPLIGTG